MDFDSVPIRKTCPNNRLSNAHRSIDSVRHHCKHSKVRKRTKTLYRANEPSGEQARGRKNQEANRQRGEKARHPTKQTS